MRGGVIAVPNPRAGRSVGKKLQNSQHLLSKIVDILPPRGHKSVVSEVYAVLFSLYTAASEKGHCCTATNVLQFILWCVTFIS